MVGFVYFLQNHFSATFLMVAITFVQMFAAGANIGYLFGLGGLGGMGIITYLATKGGFRLERIMTWRDIESDKIGKGYQINQSLYAIGSGGPFGRGFGNSNQKYLYLPESENDFIFAILAEEMGFIGCIGVIILYLVFIWRGLFLATRAEDKLGSLIATGIVVMIGLQALVNIMVVTNTIPVTGMPLPFFSYGGSAMIADLMAIGILLSISRHAKKEERDR
jgi:cell division protein FtsW